jgi:acetoin utilization protein AcuC
MPDRLPDAAQAVLRALVWPGGPRRLRPGPHMFETLQDAPRHGPIRDMLRARLGVLTARLAL